MSETDLGRLGAAFGSQVMRPRPNVPGLSGDGALAAPFAPLAVELPEFNFQPGDLDTISETQQMYCIFGSTSQVDMVSVPLGRNLRIDAVGFTAGDPTSLAFTEWQFLANGTPVAGFNAMPCALGSVTRPYRIVAMVPEGNTLSVKITNSQPSNTVSTAFSCTVTISGWLIRRQKRGA